jgi:hypothetical protein
VQVELVGAAIGQRAALRAPGTRVLHLYVHADPVQEAHPHGGPDPREGRGVGVHIGGPTVGLAAQPELAVEAERGVLGPLGAQRSRE